MVHKSVGLPSSAHEVAGVHLAPAREDDLEYLDILFEHDVSLMPRLQDCRIIDSVFVPKRQRGKGVGTKLIKAECRRADIAGYWLIAHAYPWEAMEDTPPDSLKDFEALAQWRDQEFDTRRARLVGFYARAGFVHADGGWCYRKPSKKK